MADPKARQRPSMPKRVERRGPQDRPAPGLPERAMSRRREPHHGKPPERTDDHHR